MSTDKVKSDEDVFVSADKIKNKAISIGEELARISNEEAAKPHNPKVFSPKELLEMKTFLEDSWETMAETLNLLSAFQADDRESAITEYVMAQHRIVVRLVEYHMNQLTDITVGDKITKTGENEDGTAAGN